MLIVAQRPPRMNDQGRSQVWANRDRTTVVHASILRNVSFKISRTGAARQIHKSVSAPKCLRSHAVVVGRIVQSGLGKELCAHEVLSEHLFTTPGNDLDDVLGSLGTYKTLAHVAQRLFGFGKLFVLSH
ncbi:unannotated protein [freshwater metagenome]|uniref:Unannotated protein n=1 Tax=freshwater metagenome TaxID=449393 RepID=A0A6J6CC02_9ZZZZ